MEPKRPNLLEQFCASPLEYLFFGYIYIAQIYYAYRYILKINSTATSPSYANGGLFERIAKYALTMAFYFGVIGIIYCHKKYKDKIKAYFANKVYRNMTVLLVIFCVFILIDTLVFHGFSLAALRTSFAYDFIFKFLFVIPLFFIAAIIYDKKVLSWFMWFIVFGVIFHFLYTIVQIGLLVTLHRLPALAYAHGSIRFGGGWDDPNGVSLFYILSLCVLAYDQNILPIYRYILIAILVVLLLLGLSFTALFLLFVLGILLFIQKKYATLTTIFASILISVAFLVVFSPNYIQVNIVSKIPSAQSHIAQVFGISLHTSKTATKSKPVVVSQHSLWQKISAKFSDIIHVHQLAIKDLLIGKRETIFSEDFYASLFSNFGLLGLGLFLSIWVYGAVKLRLWIHEPFGIFLFLLLLGSLGLPYFGVFPLNAFIWICFGFLFRINVNSNERR